MNKTITLPSGATVELRDPETLLKKDRDKVLASANEAEGVLRAVAIQDGIIAVSVASWSFDLIPPSVKITSLGELTPKDYTALVEATQETMNTLFPDFGVSEDPKATTANFNDLKMF